MNRLIGFFISRSMNRLILSIEKQREIDKVYYDLIGRSTSS